MYMAVCLQMPEVGSLTVPIWPDLCLTICSCNKARPKQSKAGACYVPVQRNNATSELVLTSLLNKCVAVM